jgi:2-desacetyl-2-hydroxyethyl bacteriochlorophyllide A dehydrogenase
MGGVKRQTLTFTAPHQVELREESLPVPGTEDVLVETLCSAISAGTELLIYRGQFPKELADSNDALSSGLKYPLAYGYACVGVVKETGSRVDQSLKDRLVFAFQPHTTRFIAHPETLFPIPEGIGPEAACFLPNMETAVNLVQDAAPILGERALVLGQGVIGLLAASLLSEFPLEKLAVADHLELRRKALHVGRSTLNVQRFDSGVPNFRDQVKSFLPDGADLTLELSGSPSALNDAIGLTAFSGRIVIGSWYGEKRVALDLGGAFHRSRLKLISSQVSTIAPELSGRWDKSRRFGVAWDAIQRIRPEQWITHRFPLRQAAEAYRLLDENPQEAIQVIFTMSS